ncbi:hypothetical protein X801_02579 [Opisthorchis viverrini]|nr:hypothetical protein X801_02579 [Opisthorchis viverrini]
MYREWRQSHANRQRHPVTMGQKCKFSRITCISVSTESSTVGVLQEKLRLIEAEKEDLMRQLQLTMEEHARQKEILIARYVNADYLLSQCESLLPVKRMPSCKPHSMSIQSWDTPLVCRHLLEPASNLVYSRMCSAIKDAQLRVRQSNDDLIAWKFDPESPSGKRLMSRMRHLLNENEALGRANQAERIAVLEREAEAQTNCIKEFSKTHEGIESVLEEAYTDLEGLQTSLLQLHQQINQAESVVEALQAELEIHEPGRVAELMKAVWEKLDDSKVEHQEPDPNQFEATEAKTVCKEEQADDTLQTSNSSVAEAVPVGTAE